MMGFELSGPGADLPKRALRYKPEYGLLINVTQDRVVRLLPALVMNVEEATLLAEGSPGRGGDSRNDRSTGAAVRARAR